MNKSIIKCILLSFATASMMCGCGDTWENDYRPEQQKVNSGAANIMEKLWNTRPWDKDMNTRKAMLDSIQKYADDCSSTNFDAFLAADSVVANTLETYDDLYICYRKSFEKVLSEVKETRVENGTATIWMLYNMGYIVKTPSGCFGIDICHRDAEMLAPYLDFLCITHNHQDHYSKPLIEAMLSLGKPVISNYIAPTAGYQYKTTKAADDFTIGKFLIHTCLTDHNNDKLKLFDTTYQIDCGDDTGHFVIMHVGDSNYNASQYTVTEDVDVFIPRYAPNALSENNVIGTIVKPKYVLLSHILEMTHTDTEASRWSFEMAFERASRINCDKTYVPFWGEKMVWKNGMLN